MRHSVSIIRGTLFIASFGILAGCPPSRVNPVTNRVQGVRYERIALGFQQSPPSVVFLELRDGMPPRVRQHRLDRLEEHDVLEVDPSLAGFVADETANRQVIIDRLAASSMGGRLEATGMRWVTPRPPPVTSVLGTIERRGEHVIARADDATQATLAELGDAVLPESELWLTSPDGDMVALELTYPGVPRVRDLRVFETRRIDAQLGLVRAEQALDRRADGEASERLDFAAERLSPGDPLVAVVAFTRARIAARARDVSGCVVELEKATALDSRYRDRAVRHDDFDGVRKHPRFIDFLTLAPP